MQWRIQDLTLGGGVNFVNGWGGGRKSLKVLTVEVKVILGCFSHVSTKIRLEMNRERSELKKHREK